MLAANSLAKSRELISVVVVEVVVSIPLHGAAPITNEDENAPRPANSKPQGLLRCWQLLMEVLGNYSDTQPLQPLLTAAGAMVLVLEYLRATKNSINRSCQQQIQCKNYKQYNMRHFICPL